jgi:uncharacterized repeat protein (TIGR01451 family)/LPXTG-motif cell wall-anchored protein
MSKPVVLKLGVVSFALSVVVAMALQGMPVNAAPPDPEVVNLGITPTPTSVSGPTATPETGVKVVDPVITKRGEPAEALPGEEVVFTIEVTNQGQNAAVGVLVTDELPEYLEIVEATTTQGTVRVEGQVVYVEVGVVGPEFLVVIVIRTRVRPDAPIPLELQNVAVLHSPNGGNRTSPPVVITIPDEVLLPQTGGTTVAWGILAGGLLSLIGLAGHLLGRKDD